MADGKEAIVDEAVGVHRGTDRLCPPVGLVAQSVGQIVLAHARWAGYEDILTLLVPGARGELNRGLGQATAFGAQAEPRIPPEWRCRALSSTCVLLRENTQKDRPKILMSLRVFFPSAFAA